MTERRVFGIAFAVALLVGGLGLGTVFWTRDTTYYASYTRETRLDAEAFHFARGDHPVALADLLAIDADLRAKLLCQCVSDYGASIVLEPFFDANEAAHLRDVGGVFGMLLPATAMAALVVALLGGVLFVRDRRLLRTVAIVDAAVVAAVGVLAAVAFEPMFLVFHEIFFPQGNFLFDPRTENLVLLYPEGYWLGVTLRLGATFLLLTLAVAALASVPIGSTSARDDAAEGEARM